MTDLVLPVGPWFRYGGAGSAASFLNLAQVVLVVPHMSDKDGNFVYLRVGLVGGKEVLVSHPLDQERLLALLSAQAYLSSTTLAAGG